jgi:hypothetical protein
MAKTILDPTTLESILQRVDKLTPDTVPQWGVLKPNQMVRHLRAALPINSGELVIPDRSTFMSRTLIRWFVLNSMVPSVERAKKNPIQTLPEINVVKKPIESADLETEKRLFKEAQRAIIIQDKWAARSPLLGKMSKGDQGKLMHSHAHYHLTQFGV